MSSVLFFDFLNDVVRVQCVREHIVRARFNFGRVSDLSVQEELCMVTNVVKFVWLESCEERLRFIF